MAHPRVYRDYFEENTPRRSPSLRHTLAPSYALKESDDERLRRSGHGIGIAHTIDEDEVSRGAGHDDDTYEPVLHETQIDIRTPEPTFDLTPAEMEGSRAFSPTSPYEQHSLSPVDAYSKRTSFSPSNIHSRSVFSPSGTSETSSSSISHHDATSSATFAGSKLPEFFSQTVFQTALHHPTIAHNLQKFAETRLCGENMAFLARISKYHVMLNDISQAMLEIHTEFLTTNAPNQINVPEHLQMQVTSDIKKSLRTTVPTLESVFINAQSEIERLVQTDIYPKFVRNQMGISAAMALAVDRTKYAGLGDCFVLTDPAKADNPIMFASDGFIKVTGYSRNEIIPRNCRFLQSRHTDRAAVKRLRAAIDKGEESVELLLNTKKNGEPFWNLLYTTPLYDGHGKLVFFLGAQINCSTTIHNANDVLRILAQMKEPEAEPTPSVVSPPPMVPRSSRRSLFATFRTKSDSKVQQGAPGMENNLLNRIGDRDLKGQMSSFYNAYSNVCRASLASYTSVLETLR